MIDAKISLEAKEGYVKKLLETEERHFKKHSYRKMNDKELDELFVN